MSLGGFILFTATALLVKTTMSASSEGIVKAEVVILDYHDLVERKDLSHEIEKAFGKDGIGLLTVKNVPEMSRLRENLLPLARRFAMLDDAVKEKYVDEKSYYSFGWSHGKEKLQGKPDSSKGSYYANPLVDTVTDDAAIIAKYPDFATPNIWPTKDLPEMEDAFKKMGQRVCDVGVLVAHQCDRYVQKCHTSYSPGKMERIMATSTCAKARLLHYFARTKEECDAIDAKQSKGDDAFSDWCGWHNDHGSLTGLLPAMFIDEHGMQTTNADPDAGLYIRNRKGELVKAGFPADHIAFQIGECSQVHTGGALQATPHAVRGANLPGVSRETFAVFMEPMWDEPMDTPEGVTKTDAQSQEAAKALPEGVPALSTRWETTQNFGAFTKSTLSAYY